MSLNKIDTKLEKFKSSLNGNMYRFDKASNFINYEEWKIEKIERYKRILIKDKQSEVNYSKYSDNQLITKIKSLHDLHYKDYNQLSEEIKKEHIKSLYELQRRNLSL